MARVARRRRARRRAFFYLLLALVVLAIVWRPGGGTRRETGGRAVPSHSLALAAGAPELILPVPGRTGSGFGWRLGPGGRVEFHTGVDIPAAEGTPVVAAAAGRVTKIADDPAGYGRYLIIDHGDGWETLYAHNAKITVVLGQRVEQGHPVARVGGTGNATRPHLHLELRFGGEPVDPLPHVVTSARAHP